MVTSTKEKRKTLYERLCETEVPAGLFCFDGTPLAIDGKKYLVDLLRISRDKTFYTFISQLDKSWMGDMNCRYDILERVNVYEAVYLNSMVFPKVLPGVRLPTQAELDAITTGGTLQSLLNPEDDRSLDFTPVSILLRQAGHLQPSGCGQWKYDAQWKQLHYDGKRLAQGLLETETNLHFPYLIPLTSLKLVENKKSILQMNLALKNKKGIIPQVLNMLEAGCILATDPKTGYPSKITDKISDTLPDTKRRFLNSCYFEGKMHLNPLTKLKDPKLCLYQVHLDVTGTHLELRPLINGATYRQHVVVVKEV